MRKSFLPILISLIFISGEVSAEELRWNEDIETQAFNGCYEKINSSNDFGGCNFVKRCIEAEAENSTSQGIRRCSKKGYELWGAKLDFEYERLISLVDQIYGSEAVISLKNSQAIWSEFHKTDCMAKSDRSDYLGSLGGAAYLSCLYSHTAERTLNFKLESRHHISRGYKP